MRIAGDTLAFSPPLVITRDEIGEMVEKMGKVLRAVSVAGPFVAECFTAESPAILSVQTEVPEPASSTPTSSRKRAAARRSDQVAEVG